MSNIFHELGKTVNQKISGLLDTFKSTNNIWTGTNDFLKSIGIGTDASAERSVDLKVGTEDTPQDLKAFGDIKVDGQQNLGNLADFTAALGQVANNGMASQIENLESRLHNLRTFYPNARPVAGEEIGEMIFDLEQSVILVWNGLEWLELGGKVPVTLKVFADGEGTVTGAGEYSKGEEVYITAIPKPNFGFKEWTGMGVDAGMVQSPSSEGTFINMSQSWTVTAKFGLVDHLLLVTVTGGGSAEGNNTEWAHGTKATIKAIPGPNSDFIEWTGEGVDSPFSLESTVTMTSARTVEAVFSLKNHLLTLLAEGGTATTTTGLNAFEHGTQAEITATPDSIHDFANWSGAGLSSDVNLTTATVDMTEPRTITANFSLKEYQLQVQAGTGGTTSGSGIYEHFETASITATPDDANGYEFNNWTGDVQTSDSAATTVDITGETIVVANFKLKEYLLSLSAYDLSNSVAGGGVVIGGDISHQHNTMANCEAQPDSIYEFVSWTGGPVDNGTDAATYIIMDQPYSLVANFRYKQYILTVIGGAGGSASGSGTYPHFDEVDIVASADDANGYEFDNWSTDSGVIASTGSESTKITISGTHTVTANFKLKDYALSIDTYDLSNSAPGGGVTTGSGVKQHGETVTVTATADPEYDFEAWYNPTGNPVGDDHNNTTNTITMDDGAITIVANFRYKQYGLVINAGTGGTVSGAGTYSHFDQADIEATPDDANGYEFEGWTKDSGDGNIANISVEDTIVEILSNTEVTANFKLKDYIVYTGAKFKGKISLGGYYPLYETANEANADTDGDGTHHSHDINGVTYYMPNGLSNQYHGTHSFPWGTLGLYDEENPGDPDAPTGPWGSTPVTKQHGTNGWYYANPAQYYVYDGIVTDSRNTLPFLDASAPAGPIQINNNLNYIANFSLLQYSLNIMHYPTGEWVPNTLSPASAYWGDIQINGDNTQANSGSGSQEEFPGLIADGVWTDTNVSQLYWTGDFDAFSQQTIKAIPKTADGYGFIEWVEPAGQSLVADNESPETTVTITPEGTNTGNKVELAARFGRLPISTFLTSGDLYFGETLEFADVSTAPSGDGTIVSSEYTNDKGIAFNSRGNFLRTFQGVQEHGQIEISNPGDIMDLSKTWCVMLDFFGPPISYPSNYHFVGLNRGETILGGLGPSSHVSGNFSFHTRWFQNESAILNLNSQIAYSNRLIYYCDGTTLYETHIKSNGETTTVNTPTSSWDALLGADTSKLYIGSGKNTSRMVASSSQISNQGFNISANWNSILFYEGSLPTDSDMVEFLTSDDGTDPTTYSFYGNLYDAIKCATKRYPSLDGEKGNMQAEFIEGNPSQFKSFATLDLPAGSPGDTTGSVDVTLTVTDDQGLTDTETQNITYGPKPLESSEFDYTPYVVTTDGLNLLGGSPILGATMEETETFNGTDVTLTTEHI